MVVGLLKWPIITSGLMLLKFKISAEVTYSRLLFTLVHNMCHMTFQQCGLDWTDVSFKPSSLELWISGTDICLWLIDRRGIGMELMPILLKIYSKINCEQSHNTHKLYLYSNEFHRLTFKVLIPKMTIYCSSDLVCEETIVNLTGSQGTVGVQNDFRRMCSLHVSSG